MGALGDVIARLHSVVDTCGRARDNLNHAADQLEEASTQFAHAMES